MDTDAPPVPRHLAEQAVQWAQEAGRLTLGHFRSADLGVEHKADGSPVTVADREAERLMRDRILAAHPDDTVIGEEHEDHHGHSGRRWVIDPIDGTKAFSRGVGTYSNLLYLEDEHGPAVGVINMPALGETVWAGRGLGCHLGSTRTRVRAHGRGLEGAVLCVSGFHRFTAETFGRLQAEGVEVRTWGDAYGYALLATGRVDAMYDPELAWWDLAAVLVVVAEAGGRITRADGTPEVTTPHRRGAYAYSALASVGPLHDRWADLLSANT
jgi:histidinol phosphatase-like enzyme (inositol monophosphatase family)